MQIGQYYSTRECVQNIWKSKGIVNGFYAGFGVFIAREIPFCQIMYPLYEVLKLITVRTLAYNSGTPAVLIEVPGYLNSINGAIAGAIAGFLTTPLDVLKTRLMTFQVEEDDKRSAGGLERSVKQIVNETKKIYR